jgi:hypothetical protein
VLRVHAKGVLVRKTSLTTGGAYRLVRHPFYLANLIGVAGVFALAGTLGLAYASVFMVVAVPVFLLTIRGEEHGLRALYGAAFDGFARRVPALVPLPGRLGPRPRDPVRVSWTNLVREHEPARLLRFLAGALAVSAFASPATAGEVSIVGAAALWSLSHVVQKPPSRRVEGMDERP